MILPTLFLIVHTVYTPKIPPRKALTYALGSKNLCARIGRKKKYSVHAVSLDRERGIPILKKIEVSCPTPR